MGWQENAPAAAEPYTALLRFCPKSRAIRIMALQPFWIGAMKGCDRPDQFSPIQGVGICPRLRRLAQPIAGPDEIVGGSNVLGSIRNKAVPAIAARPRFHRAHQPQLKPASAMLLQYADATDVSSVADMRRWHDAGKGDRYRFAIRQPPWPPSNGGIAAPPKNVRRCRSASVSAISSSNPSTSRIRYTAILASPLIGKSC